MTEVDSYVSINGVPIFSNDYIEKMRESDSKNANPLFVSAQRGCQEKFLSDDADIIIYGGQRGGGKSWSLLAEALTDIYNPKFNAIILRDEKPDLEGLINESNGIFSQFGRYNSSINDMTWNFDSGAKLHFWYYADEYKNFVKRFQGKQYAYIGIDEITHMPYRKFKYLMTDNRNPYGIKNRIKGTCNPDPESWVRKFIDWWIGEDGYPILERDGVKRYCFMDGSSVDSIYWGNTPEEVYDQCSRIIDALWKPAYEALGFNKKTMFIKSVTFIVGKLEENIKLIANDPNYYANLAQQDEEQRLRDLCGNWNFKAAGDDMIKLEHLDKMFNNAYQLQEHNERFASCDVAFTGGDSCVLWLWYGMHIKDLFVCRRNSKETIDIVKAKLQEWGVPEYNFTYDYNGLGQSFGGFFPKAVTFINNGAVDKKFKYIYGNLKSQCAYIFAQHLWDGDISIQRELLDRKYSGKGFTNETLRSILKRERKCIRANEQSADNGFTLIKKDTMKKYVGHSPDYFESLLMRFIFEVKNNRNANFKGLWRI